MKKITSYICLSMLCFLLACKEDALTTYNNQNSKNSIYFAEAKDLNNFKAFSFGYEKANVKDSILSFIVRAIGAPENRDRPYDLNIADSSTLKSGTEYEILNKPLSIKAGKVSDTLKIKLLRANTLRNQPLFLYMDLKPNNNFTNDFLIYTKTTNGVTTTGYQTRMTLKVDDIAGAPPFWTIGNSNYNITVGYFGAFSRLKFQLLITYYNLDVDQVVAPNWFNTDNNSRRFAGWANGLKAYLTRMAAAGTPVYEEDGVTLMKMGIYAQ